MPPITTVQGPIALDGSAPGLPPVLRNHPTQSATTIDGWRSVLFGLPFLLAGVGIAFGALYASAARKHGPEWLIFLIASFFFFAGAFLVIHGLRGAARQAEYARQTKTNPGQPWLADYAWNREGFTFSAFNTMLKRFLGALLWNAFLVPFAWIGLTQRGLATVFAIFAAIFALLGLYFWIRWFKMLAEMLRFGNSVLYFDTFPYFLGNPFTARLHVSRNLNAFDELRVTFRCVQEKYVVTSMNGERTSSVVCYELYSDSATLSRAQLSGSSDGTVAISFRIPPQQAPTRLCSTPPIYWEIEARGKGRGADYEAYFLVPVYRAS